MMRRSQQNDYSQRGMYHITLRVALLSAALCGCSLIDDDLDNCPDYRLDYELRLVTNMTIEIQTQLTDQTDAGIANALREHLSSIFTDYAHDADLSFYDTKDDSLRLYHDEHIMDANQASYTLFLPMREYQHLAVANVADNPLVAIGNDERCHASRLQQAAADTIDSHTTGLFTARQPMEVLQDVDQSFHVHLYMANCAAALVIDPRDHDVSRIRVFTTGFATQFSIYDSVYTYAGRAPLVRTELIEDDQSPLVGFCSVNFPSREPKATRSNDYGRGRPRSPARCRQSVFCRVKCQPPSLLSRGRGMGGSSSLLRGE